MAQDFLKVLGTELECWVREGIITQDQRARIAARYQAGEARSRAVVIAILSLVGGALVTAGLGLVIAHNWQLLSDWIKIGGLVTLMAGAYAGGHVLRERGHGGTGEALLMVGGALFLCGIALVGQIYHLNARPPNAVLLWIAALFPAAYLLRSSPVLTLALGGLLVWIGMEAGRNDSILYLGDSRGDHIYPAYFALYLAAGVGLAAAGRLHAGSFERFSGLYESIGILAAGAGLYLLGFLRHIGGDASDSAALSGLGPVAAFSLIALGLLAVSWKRLPSDPPRTRATHIGLMALSLGLALAPGILGRMGLPRHDTAITLTLVYWVFLLLFSLHLISAGVRWERPGWISLGIILVGLNIVTRYFDVLGSRLDQGLLYIMGGVLILAVSLILERQRRRLLRHIAQKEAP